MSEKVSFGSLYIVKGGLTMGGFTLTVITAKAMSLNYGENIGNVSVLKKVSLGDGTQLTYVSDKALKYDIRRKGKEEKGWKLMDSLIKNYVEDNLENNKLNVDNFGKKLVKDYHEFDLFGGLFTNFDYELSYGDSVKRTSPVKLTYAFSISPFKGDVNFLNNIDAYNRYIKHIEKKDAQAIANNEEHTSHYVYTLTVDLDRVGVWEEGGLVEKKEEVLTKEERAKRVVDLLDIVFTLNRQIRGRWEDLSPVFVVGGVFKVKHPFFIKGVHAVEENGKLFLDTRRLEDAKKLVPEEDRDNVVIGLHAGVFGNEEDIKNLGATSIGDALERLKAQVRKHYGVS